MPRALGLTQVTIVEDHLLFAESLELALNLDGHDVRRISIPESGNSPAALLAAILRTRPRVVLLDLDLGPLGSSIRLIEPLTRARIPVVIVTGNADRARWGECLSHGARGVLDKSCSLNTILATIRRIGEGRALHSVEDRERMLRSYHCERSDLRDIRLRLERLTPREGEVLGLLSEGLTVREIASRFVVSEATVRSQVKSMLAKLEVSSQLAAVGAAHRADWRGRTVANT